MASKIKREKTPTRNGHSEQPFQGTERPKTPTTRSRIEEKNALIGLNNRLAAILERKTQLEDENALLSKELKTEREHTIQTLTRVKQTYDNELEELRRHLEMSEKERAKLSLACNKLQSEFNDRQARLDKANKELADLKNRISKADGQINKLSIDLQRALEDRNRVAGERNELEDENNRLAAAIDELRKRLEDECMDKIELQNLMQGQSEDFIVKSQIFEQEISNIKSLREIEIEEVDKRLKKDYDSKLEHDIQKLRDEYEKQAQKNKEAQDNLYKTKEADLQAQMNRLKNSIDGRNGEFSLLTTKLSAALQKLNALEGENYSNQQIIKELERKMAEDRAMFEKEIAELQRQLDELRAEKSKLITEYQDLWDTKVGLDNEIATYHMLLEGEERRLNEAEFEVEDVPDNKPVKKRTTIKETSFLEKKNTFTKV